MKAIGGTAGLRAMATGVIGTLVLALILAAAAAALIGGGLLPTDAMPAAACIITGIAALLGSVLCGKRAERARLPLCLAAGVVYLLVIFVLRGLAFRSVGENLWAVPLCVLAAAAVGAMLTSRKKQRR